MLSTEAIINYTTQPIDPEILNSEEHQYKLVGPFSLIVLPDLILVFPIALPPTFRSESVNLIESCGVELLPERE